MDTLSSPGPSGRGDVSVSSVTVAPYSLSGGWSTPPQPVDTALHLKEVETEIFACLEAAPLRQTLAFILREVEELSAEDICNVLGITRTNLGVMLHRIRNRVRDCLESKGVRR